MDLTQADDHDIEESMHAFEAAVSAQKQLLTAPAPRRILLALDGSNQDDTSAALAVAIATRHGVPIMPMRAAGAEGTAAETLTQRAERLREAGAMVTLPARTDLPSSDLSSAEQILGLAERGGCDLIVVCAPYLDDYTSLGELSVGPTVDMLLGRAGVPLLIVREPKTNPASCLHHVLVPITVHPPEHANEAAWALDLVESEGDIRILAVVDRELLESADEALQSGMDFSSLDEQQLAGLRRPATAGLIAALQREASAQNLGCRVSVRVGELVAVTSEMGNEDDLVIVTGCPREPSSVANQRVQAMVRASRNPLLVV